MTMTTWTPRPGNLTKQHGLSLVKNNNGFAVLSVHYTADPDKDTLEWFEKTRKGYSEAKWRQEYEINYELSGSLVFDKGVLEWYSNQCVAPEVGKLNLKIDEDKAIYQTKFTKGFGDLRVWKHPEKDKRYVIGVDVSEGLGEGMGDWSVATVLEYESMECVAVWRGQYSPDLLAVESHNLVVITVNWSRFLDKHTRLSMAVISALHDQPPFFVLLILTASFTAYMLIVSFHSRLRLSRKKGLSH